mgnify:CR=1 FL=1
MSIARTQGAGTGVSTSALAFGGEVPPNTAATEEWNVPSNVVKTLTD